LLPDFFVLMKLGGSLLAALFFVLVFCFRDVSEKVFRLVMGAKDIGVNEPF